ncbi:unnamed protein product [Dracunculus medinensis]|uniref:Uncharacterized protein n=1 Tax=Dracunculus medinensis TaxID=318479 RepID=A0A0N4UR20_DRAME|nr:unnamed protein product [Dracunculus medinensis]
MAPKNIAANEVNDELKNDINNLKTSSLNSNFVLPNISTEQILQTTNEYFEKKEKEPCLVGINISEKSTDDETATADRLLAYEEFNEERTIPRQTVAKRMLLAISESHSEEICCQKSLNSGTQATSPMVCNDNFSIPTFSHQSGRA